MSSNINYPIPPGGSNPQGKGPGPDYEKLIQEAIIQDPIITDSNNVSVSFNDKALGKGEIRLIGKVGSDEQKQRAQELAESNTTDKIEVINELVVE
jgi:hypothetical protein